MFAGGGGFGAWGAIGGMLLAGGFGGYGGGYVNGGGGFGGGGGNAPSSLAAQVAGQVAQLRAQPFPVDAQARGVALAPVALAQVALSRVVLCLLVRVTLSTEAGIRGPGPRPGRVRNRACPQLPIGR